MLISVASMSIVSLSLIAFCTGCAINTGPIQNRKEFPDIRAGKRAVLLIRVTFEQLNGETKSDFGRYGVNVGVGGFETGGEISLRLNGIDGPFFLSGETSSQGWAYFIAKPSTYYLAFLRPRTTDYFSYIGYLKSAQRWRIEITKGARVVYGGTVHLICRRVQVLFETRCHEDRQMGVLKNEKDMAHKLASEHLSELGAPITSLLQRHRAGPGIIKKSN